MKQLMKIPQIKMPKIKMPKINWQVTQPADIVLVRFLYSDHGTFGKMEIDGETIFTAEPPDRNNKPNLSCLPIGRYGLIPHESPRFGETILLTDTDPREVCLIHTGNLAGDSQRGLKTHTQGCILPGMRYGNLPIKSTGYAQRAVLASRIAMSIILDIINEPMTLEIRND